MKESDKKILIVLVTAFTALALFAVVVIVKEKNRPVSLSQYIRDEGIELFVEIDWQNNIWQEYMQAHEGAKIFLNNFLLNNELPPAFLQNNIGLKKLALVVVDTDEGLKKVWLIQVENKINDLSVYMSGYYFSVLDAETGILSLAKEPIDKIKFRKENNLAFGYGNNFFAGRQTDLVLVRATKNFLDGEDVNFKFSNSLFANYLSWQNEDFIYFNFNITDSGVVFWWSVPFDGDKGGINKSNDYNKFLSIEDTIEIKEIGVADVLAVMKQEIDEEGNVSWELLQKYIQDKYKIDIQTLNTFFEQPISLWLQPKFKLDNITDFLNLDNYNYVIAVENWLSDDKSIILDNLENFITNYFAFKYPVERIKILPDKTIGMERAANTAGFSFADIGDNELAAKDEIKKMIKNKNLEFIYYTDNNKLLLSNNSNFLEVILSGLNSHEDDVRAELFGSDVSDYMIEFDSGLLGEDYYLLGRRVRFKSDFLDDQILIQGMFWD